jgi:multiple sugar transport system permease protein
MTTNTAPRTKKSPATGQPETPGTPQGRRRTVDEEVSGSAGRRLLKHIVLIAFGVIMLYPLLWMLVSSLRPNDMIFREAGLWLTTFEFSNYTEGWNALQSPFGHYMMNSMIVVIGSIIEFIM